MSITPENKVSFAPVVSTITREEEMQQKEQQQKQMQDKQQLDDKKKEEKEEEVKKVVVVEENGDIKGENESKEFNNNTTTTMSTTNTTKAKSTTTIISSCDSTSTSASMPTATAIPATTNAGHQVHTACVIPPVGRDNLRYGSLDAAAMSDEGTLLSMALIDTTTKKLRPMSSMEYAECNAASSRRPSADTTGLELTHLSAYHHTLFRPLTMVTDQVTASGAVALTNGPRLSTDQESVHPFQLDPEPRLSFDNNNNNARRTSLSSSSSLPPPFSSTSNPSSTGESWLSLAPPSSSSTVSSSDFAQSAPAPLSIQTQVGAVPHKTIRKKASLASKIRKVFIKQTMSGSSNGNNTGSSNGSSSNGSFSSKDQDVDILHHHHHHHHHHCSTQTLEDITSTSMSSSSSRDGEIDVQGGLLRNGRGGAGIGVGVGAAGELCPPPASHLIEHRGSVSSSSSGESVSVGQGGDLRPCTPSTSPEMSPSGSPKPKHATSPLIIGPSTAIADGVPYGHPLSPVEINRLAVSLAPIGPSKPTEKRMNLEQTSSRTSKKRLSFASITSFFNARNADAMAVSKKTKQQRSSSVPNVESPLTDAGRQQQGSIAFQRRHSLNDLETGPQLQAKFAAPPWDKDRVSAQAAAAAAESLIKATERETSSGAKTMSKIQGVFGKQSKKNKGKKSTSHSENAPTTTTIVSSAKPLRLALAHRPVTAPSVRKQQQQFQYHGGYVQYDGSTVPQTPRINPLSTKPMTPQANDPPNYPLVNISPCTSRGAVAEGSLTFSPTGSRRRDSYISCSSSSPSKDTSPKLPSASTPRQQQNYPGTAAAVAAAIGNPHRRSSYDATTNNRRSSYEANSRRNSIIVTSSISLSPPPKSAPVARLSVDHTLMSDHPGPSSPSAYPQAIAANGNHQHAIFANHQQQQQLQLQQQLHYQHRQFHFSTAPPMIHETWTPEQYDRTSDPNITAHRLTPAIAQRIKLELNQFKSQEMLVHQESRVNTHFFA
ncbi:hypothetical protein BGX30_007748 [Mortierella sp. GBA39]|nr:hypothetical protein BGX30_007748 [Mortierella sp. GBA39]